MATADKYLSEHCDERAGSTNEVIDRYERRSLNSLQLTCFVELREEHIEALLAGEMLRMPVEEYEVIIRAKLEWRT